MSEVKLLENITEEEPNREDTVHDIPQASASFQGVGRDKHHNILGELEDLLGPFE